MKYDEWIPAVTEFDQSALLRDGTVPRLLALALAARGFDELQDARAFLHPKLTELHDPFLFPDMEKAVSRIRTAIETREKIVVYGDYDVDGITAVTMMSQVLKSLGADCGTYIPDRLEEGYGLRLSALKTLYTEGVRLVVTVDSGITALEEIEAATALGLDFVITDHHDCREELPKAAAVLNPCVPGCPYPFRELAGVGVAFKLCCALTGSAEAVLARYADLVALGTVADVMPALGENRILIQMGLNALPMTANPGLRALMKEAGTLDRRITTQTIAYQLAPRLNAAGRMGRAQLAVDLLTTAEAAAADRLARLLCELNTTRQSVESGIFIDALAALRLEADGSPGPAIVLAAEHWHSGVTGIVASRLMDQFNVPVFMISLDGDMGKGSARSVPGIHLVEALSSCGWLLDSFGGHELAAGFSVARKNIPALKTALTDFCARAGRDTGPKTCRFDAVLRPEWITLSAVQALSALEPYGPGNLQPLFSLENLRISGLAPVGQGKHTKLTLSVQGQNFGAVWFGTEAGRLPFSEGDEVDALFRLEVNLFRNQQSVQLQMTDIRPSARQRLRGTIEWDKYRRFRERTGSLTAAEARSLLPERDDLAHIWRNLELHGRFSGVTPKLLAAQLSAGSAEPIPAARCWTALDIFAELGLIHLEKADSRWTLYTHKTTVKADLAQSGILRELRARAAP